MSKKLVRKTQAERIVNQALSEEIIDEKAFSYLMDKISEAKETPEFPEVKHYYFDKFFKENKKNPNLSYPWLWDKKDSRKARFEKQAKKYGFDERCTWSMDYSFMLWLYERLNAYLEFSIVDLSFYKWEVDGENLTEEEMVKRIIKDCETYFLTDPWSEDGENAKAFNDAVRIWGMCAPAVWW